MEAVGFHLDGTGRFRNKHGFYCCFSERVNAANPPPRPPALLILWGFKRLWQSPATETTASHLWRWADTFLHIPSVLLGRTMSVSWNTRWHSYVEIRLIVPDGLFFSLSFLYRHLHVASHWLKEKKKRDPEKFLSVTAARATFRRLIRGQRKDWRKRGRGDGGTFH